MYTYHSKLSLNIPRPLQRIIILALPQRTAVDIRRKIAHGCFDSAIQRTAVREMST